MIKKVYRGKRVSDEWVVTVQLVGDHGKERPLHHVEYHSPDGFSWGYGGSGPADLALSILSDMLGERLTKSKLVKGKSVSWDMHQRFKWAFVQTWPQEGSWEIHSDIIARWLSRLGVDTSKFTGRVDYEK